jgi:hypothetical protein
MCSALQAQIRTLATAERTEGWLVSFNAEYGGDAVSTVLFDDGSTQDVRAGQGVSLSIGRFVRPNAGRYMVSGGLGFKYVTTKASNADITLTRFVVDARADYGLPNHFWIGAGPVLHLGASFNADGLGPDESFDPAVGLNLRFGWKALSVTYTAMRYEARSGGTFNAGAIGFGGHYPF